MDMFRDRYHAGKLLGEALSRYAHRDDVLVLGLPRGGVPIAYVVAHELETPLDVLVVRKIGVPGYEELAMGALASGDILVMDRHIVRQLGITHEVLRAAIEREHVELQRRERLFRGDHPPLDVTGRTVILIDDGIATGSTMLAAIQSLMSRKPARIVLAVPVASRPIAEAMQQHVDEVVCLLQPEDLRAVGLWYEDFSQTTDEEVRQLLDLANVGRHPAAYQPAPAHA